MKRLYICRADHHGYDQYDAMVVRATSAQQAREIATETAGRSGSDQVWSASTLHPDRGPCDVVLASFNAG